MIALVVGMCIVAIFPFVIAATCAALVTLGSGPVTQGEEEAPVAATYQPMVILTHATHA